MAQGWSNPRIWDAVTGAPITGILDVPLLEYGYVPATFDPTGKWVAIGAEDGVHLFDATTGESLRHFPNDDGTRSVQFHPDGRHIVFTDPNDTLVFDAETGKSGVKHPWQWRHGGLFELDPTGRRYVLGTGAIEDWELEDDVPGSPSSMAAPRRVAFSRDGERLMSVRKSGARSEVVRVADGDPLTPPWRFDNGQLRDSLDRTGRFLVRRDGAGVWLWDLDARPRVLGPFAPLEGKSLRAVVFDESHRRMFVLSDSGEVTTWETAGGRRVGPPFTPPGQWSRIVPGPLGERIALVGNGPDAATEPTPEEERLDMTADGRNVWFTDREVQVWAIETGRAITSPLAHRTISEVRFRPNGRQLAVVANLRLRQPGVNALGVPNVEHVSELTAWDLDSGRTLVDRRPFTGTLNLGGFRSDGSRLRALRTLYPDPSRPTESREEWIQWDTESWTRDESGDPDTKGERSFEIRRHERGWRIDDGDTGAVVVELEGEVDGRIEAVEFTRDRTRVAIAFGMGDWNRRIRIQCFDVRSGHLLCPPMIEPLTAYSRRTTLAHAPDGRILAVAGDGVLRLWDTTTGLALTPALPLVGEESVRSRPTRLAFSPHGRRLLVFQDHTLRELPIADVANAIPSEDVIAAWFRILSENRIDEAGATVPVSTAEMRESVSIVRDGEAPR